MSVIADRVILASAVRDSIPVSNFPCPVVPLKEAIASTPQMIGLIAVSVLMDTRGLIVDSEMSV